MREGCACCGGERASGEEGEGLHGDLDFDSWLLTFDR